MGPSGPQSAARRGLCAVFAVTAAGGVAVAALATASPSATAATDPCAASEVAKTLGSVATTTGSYLDSHPETNTALTMITQQQAGPQSLVALKTYFDANPQAGKDMQLLQQPLVNLSDQVQAAADASPADGADAVHAVAARCVARCRLGDDVAGRFAKFSSLRTDGGRAGCRRARPAVPCPDPHAGRWAASRPLGGRRALTRQRSAGRSVDGTVNWIFRVSGDWFSARQESRHRFCLAFRCR